MILECWCIVRWHHSYDCWAYIHRHLHQERKMYLKVCTDHNTVFIVFFRQTLDRAAKENLMFILLAHQQRQNYPSAATSPQKQRSRRPSWHWEMGKRQDRTRYQQRPFEQTGKRPPTCYTASSARSGRRKRYRLSGKKVSWSCCPTKETSGTATTIEGSCSCPGKVLNRVLLERMKEAVDPKLWDQQAGFAETDHVRTRSQVYAL